jgi:hypothetical protein
VHLHFGFFRDGAPVNPRNYITYSCCSLNGTSLSSATQASGNALEASDPNVGGHDYDLAVDGPRIYRPIERRYPLAL